MRPQREVWDAIAASFDRTRARPWPHVEGFLAALPQGARVLDLMAGNGRHSLVADDAGLDAVWLDWSRALATLSSERLPHIPHIVADAARLPFADASFDAAICVAALHGLPDPDTRAASLRELKRVLKPDAPAQLTVWSRDAPRFRDLPARETDVVVPWKADGFDEARTYHLYRPAALRAALEGAGFRVHGIDEVAIAAKEPDNLVALASA
ncbi:MAG: class I SAM-dependent methyltransferase [Candidatus Thermoplasmatota archaeon]